MDIQINSAERGTTSGAHLNGHAIDAELAGNMRNPGIASLVQGGVDQLTDRHRSSRKRRTRDQELGKEGRRCNEFMDALSHELRNSLGAIGNATHILRTEVSAAPAVIQARLLIERQVLQMTRVMDDFHDVSRIRSGKLSLKRARVDLSVAVSQSVSTVEFAMRQRNHRVAVSLPEGPVWLQADAARLEQVFVNLLVNAAKYTDDGGRISVSLEHGEHEAIVRVRDSGIGIAPEVLPDVFDLFTQAEPSARRVDGGLGIGLALVRALVESHGGRVTAQSAGLGQGSEFTVHLPRSLEVS